MTIIDQISADSIERGDAIIVDGERIVVLDVIETDDIDEVLVSGTSYDSGEYVSYSLYADDYFGVWSNDD